MDPDGSAPFPGQGVPPAENGPLQEIHNGRQEVGHAQAVEHRRQHRKELGKKRLYRAGIIPVKHIVEDQQGAPREKCGQPPGKILFLFLLHGGASFLMVSIIPNFCGHCKACGTSLQISAVGRVGLAFFLKGVYDMIRFITFSFSVRGG